MSSRFLGKRQRLSAQAFRVPVPGDHGGDAATVAAALGRDPATMIDLSASMNPNAPDTVGVLAGLLATQPHAITAYPNPTAAEKLLAGAIGVDPDRLLLTNGAAEGIALAAAEVGSGHVVEPEFSLYRRHLPMESPDAPRWRSNPSNPLGLLAASTDTAAVWDEAFYSIATGTWTRGDDDVWRIGSLTKLWNCPGLRLGYVIAPSSAMAIRLRRAQPQWSVNGLALAALPELLSATDLPDWRANLVLLRTSFVDSLRTLRFSVKDTDVNWVLVQSPDLRSLLAPLGVVVRDCASFAMPGTFRVAVPRAGDLDRVLSAFSTVAR